MAKSRKSRASASTGRGGRTKSTSKGAKKKSAKPLKVDPRRFDAGKAKREPEDAELDHDSIARPIWTAIEACSAAIDQSSPGDKMLVPLMRAMRDTHGSMRAVFTEAGKLEELDRPNGRWADMLLLARPQYDAAFVGLLVAQDENTWVPKYGKAGWAAHALRHFFTFRRLENTSAGKKLKQTNIARLTKSAQWAGVTQRECDATIAEVLGHSPPSGTVDADRIKPLPTPGEASQYLKGGPYEELGRLLYQQWKFLCDPAHVGIASIWLRGVIRGGQPGSVPVHHREKFIHDHIVVQSIVPSFVAIMSLASVFGYRHKDNSDLLAAVVGAWRPLERGTIEGSIIWDGWVRQALGVLPE